MIGPARDCDNYIKEMKLDRRKWRMVQREGEILGVMNLHAIILKRHYLLDDWPYIAIRIKMIKVIGNVVLEFANY